MRYGPASYGDVDTDEFADALISGSHVYLAGSSGVPIPGTEFFNDQIYVVKTDAAGDVVWEKTYGGTIVTMPRKSLWLGTAICWWQVSPTMLACTPIWY